jgi:aspartate aminotransferase
MPRAANRGLNMTLSPIRSLIPYARQAKAKGKKVYHLNIGQPDIVTPPQAMEAVRAIRENVISYGPSEGLFSLREKVAVYYEKFDAHLKVEDIFVTTGASEAILFTLFATCDVGDEVIVPEPFYANYLGFAETSSVQLVPVSTFIEDSFSLPATSAFEQLITPRTKAIMLCNPGNPTGQLYSRDDLLEIVQLAKKHKIYLIVDEVYREFCYDKAFTSVLSFADAEQNVIVIDSISKVYSSCGARVGYLITRNEEVRESVLKYAQLRLCPPYLGQVLAEACYDFGTAYIDEAREEYRQRREVLFNGLSEIEGLKFYKPAAAFYNIVELPVEDSTAFCKWLLSDFSSNGATIMLAPADGFYFNRNLGKSQVRIAYILNQNHLRHALECLSEALEIYKTINKRPALSH